MIERYHNTLRRPWLVWGLSLIALLTAVYNLLLALDQALNAGEYRALGVSYPPLLRAVLALAWGIGLVRRSVSGWRGGEPWARRGLLILLSNYGVFGVLWLVVFAQSDFSRGRIPFQIALTAVLLGLVAWITAGGGCAGRFADRSDNKRVWRSH